MLDLHHNKRALSPAPLQTADMFLDSVLQVLLEPMRLMNSETALTQTDELCSAAETLSQAHITAHKEV